MSCNRRVRRSRVDEVCAILHLTGFVLADKPPEHTSTIKFRFLPRPIGVEVIGVGAHGVNLITQEIGGARALPEQLPYPLMQPRRTETKIPQ